MMKPADDLPGRARCWKTLRVTSVLLNRHLPNRLPGSTAIRAASVQTVSANCLIEGVGCVRDLPFKPQDPFSLVADRLVGWLLQNISLQLKLKVPPRAGPVELSRAGDLR
jgi:hypothetical protein